MPIRESLPPTENLSASQARQDIRRSNVAQDVASQTFRETYLLGNSGDEMTWSLVEQGYVSRIKSVPQGKEERLYTGDAPLLGLLNSISEKVADNGREILVFCAGNNSRVTSPFSPDQYCRPDIVVIWKQRGSRSGVDYTETEQSTKTWTELAAIGEVKITQPGHERIVDYVRHHLRFHPELNAVLGFTARPKQYTLFYHDASAIHRSEFGWEPGPLYELIQKLYTRPFQDNSMQIQNAHIPTWATRIGNDVYLSKTPNTSGGPDAQGGLGQRRYTTEAEMNANNKVVFIKDIWQDQRRFFFEALLLNRAHADQLLCGLVLPASHGYVLDATGMPIRTTNLNPRSDIPAPGRFKMRLVMTEVGRPLDGMHSLLKFLCAMYDACVVQRNLYRKCQILHRDISDKNIMFAPETDAYRERNWKGYADVKFVNQVLAKDSKSVSPDPACLVIDLDNGADLTIGHGTDALTELTGTPKFIARSVSAGRLLLGREFSSSGVNLPLLGGLSADHQQFMHTTEYRLHLNPGSATQPEVKFVHRLFHDAESMFWVIAWSLARSIKEGSEQEPKPNPMFSQFFHTMSRHYPMPGYNDSRRTLGVEIWQSFLHPDLAMLAPMLTKMYDYIQPEWAHRPELNAEHVHEALMRLLLEQIVAIGKEGTDINIDIGGRNPPPPPAREDPLPQSMTSSRSKSVTPLQATRSTESQNNSTGGASANTGSSNRRNKSRSAALDASALSECIENLVLKLSPASGTRAQEHSLAAQLMWLPEPCQLLKPRAHGELDPPASS